MIRVESTGIGVICTAVAVGVSDAFHVLERVLDENVMPQCVARCAESNEVAVTAPWKHNSYVRMSSCTMLLMA